jgi:hypothetical protein
MTVDKKKFDAAVRKRVVAAISEFTATHPEYLPSSTNRALIEDWLLRNGVVVPSPETLEKAFDELLPELELAEQAVTVRHTSLANTPGPKIQRVNFGGAL